MGQKGSCMRKGYEKDSDTMFLSFPKVTHMAKYQVTRYMHVGTFTSKQRLVYCYISIMYFMYFPNPSVSKSY